MRGRGGVRGVGLSLVLLAAAPAWGQARELTAHTRGPALFLGVGMATSNGMTGPGGRVSLHYRFADSFAVGPAFTAARVRDTDSVFAPGSEALFGAVGLDLQARTHVNRVTGWAALSPFVARFQADDLDTDVPSTIEGYEYVRTTGTRFGVELGVGVDLQVLHWLSLSASGRAMVSPLGPDVEGATEDESLRARSVFLFHLGPTLTF